MPIDIRVDSAERVRYSLCTGVVTDADMVAAYERVVDDPAFDPTLNVLADTRGIERVEITAGNIRKLAERRARNERVLRGQARVAVVVSSDVVFGLARMYEVYRDPQSAQEGDQEGDEKRYLVCRTMNEARQWLGLAEGPAHA
jgi:hypothetical protein